MAKFASGPASATKIPASRGLRNALVATGTGFAQPNSSAADGQKDARHEHGAHGIDVPERVETQTPEHLSSSVAEVARHPPVCDFMQRNRKKYRNCPIRKFVKKHR